MNIFTQKVNTFIIPTNKIQKVLFDPRKNKIFYEKSTVAVRTGGNKLNPVEVFVNVDFQNLKNNGAEIPESNRLNLYDREILNSVISLYNAGNQYFSPNMVLNVLSGNKAYKNGNRKSITLNNHKEIISSLEKMKQTFITIDASREGQIFNKKEYSYSGSLLLFDWTNGISLNNNSVRDCINLLKYPPLFEYSKLRKQLASTNVELLGVLSNRSIHILIKGYLLRELLWMKYSKKRKTVIRYDSLQDYLGLTLSGNEDNINHQRKTLRDNVKKCFDYWTSIKFVRGYEEEKERNVFSKIVIKL